MPHRPDLEAQLRRFGHESFRPGQERIVRNLLDGHDVLAVMSTGSGKSLVYQLAAQLRPGITVAVSPLIALMKDQTDQLAEIGIPVALIYSGQSDGENERELVRVEQGEVKLLYVTPERFENEDFLGRLRKLDVSLFVVDEAHSITEWGHDFRPAYLMLGRAAQDLGHPTMLALTATATTWVRQEIVRQLGLREPKVMVHGTDRPNLFLEVHRVEEESEEPRLLERLFSGEGLEHAGEMSEPLRTAMQGPGIVYTQTTKGARETAAWLRNMGIAADYYHGQRKHVNRERVQDEFMSGSLRVIAATNAFGMGVDKPDIRFVVHRDVPASLEEYYQEAGRAGRDGELARVVLIYRPGDLGKAAFLSGGGHLTPEKVRRAHDAFHTAQSFTLKELQAASGLSQGDAHRLVDILKRLHILRESRRRLRLAVPDFDPDEVPLEAEEHRVAYQRSRLDMMRGYAETNECRREYLLNYFGEEYGPERCGMCDNDLASPAGDTDSSQEQARSRYSIGDSVIHSTWGEGTVERVAEGKLTVLFATAGYKTLDSELVETEHLLAPAR